MRFFAISLRELKQPNTKKSRLSEKISVYIDNIELFAIYS